VTLQQRADSYAAKFAGRPPLQLVSEGVGKNRHDVIYGQWLIGNDYQNKTRYYGAYPAGYLDRVMALFPDCGPDWNKPLHVFSGSLPKSDEYATYDINPDLKPDFCGSIYDIEHRMTLGAHRLEWSLILADPPYSSEDAKKYGTPMVNRGRVFQALAPVTRVGGHVVWLDTTWPMHRKDQWRTVGRIGLTRSTNHRVRMVSIFERVAA
jgi:hypothetical protein